MTPGAQPVPADDRISTSGENNQLFDMVLTYPVSIQSFKD
jgi:hypothetical protein